MAANGNDPVLPRTDGERHLPDGMTPSFGHELNRTDDDEEDTFRILQDSGLDPSIPIDPSSLKALKEILSTPKQNHRKTVAVIVRDNTKPPPPAAVATSTVEEEQNGMYSPRVPSEVLRPILLGRVTSDLTNVGLQTVNFGEDEVITDASTTGSILRVEGTEKRILDQLQLQTAILLDLQRRVDELSQIVAMQQYQQQQQQPIISHERAAAAVPPPTGPAQPRTNGLELQQAEGPAPPRVRNELFVFVFFFKIYESILSLPTLMRQNRVAEIWRIFWALHRRDMNGRLDGNLLFKVVFMAIILLAKFTSSNRRNKRMNIPSSIQFYVAISLIGVGFLLQSGYARFFYNFFFHQNYPLRIWNGETIVVATQPPLARAVPPPQVAADVANNRPPPRAPVAAAADGHPPHRGLLRGGIARANAVPAGNVARLVTDIVYLFGSFILSILPMWKVEAMPPPPPPHDDDEEEHPQEEDEGRNNNEGNDGNDGN